MSDPESDELGALRAQLKETLIFNEQACNCNSFYHI